MPRKRETHVITKRYADSTRHVSQDDPNVPAETRDIRWDSEMAHLGLRVYPSGGKSWVVEYRAPSTGKRRFLALREYPDMDPVWARREARRVLALVDQGEDPQDVAETEKTDPHKVTWNQLIDEAEERYFPNLQHMQARRCYVHDLREVWGDRAVASVDAAEAEAAWETVATTRGPSAARSWDAVRLGTMRWALKRAMPRVLVAGGWTPPVVSQDLRSSFPQKCRGGREEYLELARVEGVWDALEEFEWRPRGVLRLMMLLGHRSGTIRYLRLSELDRERSRIRAIKHKTATTRGPLGIELSPYASSRWSSNSSRTCSETAGGSP